MSSEIEAPEQEEADKADRAMDSELKAIGAALRAIKPLGPDAKAYVLARLKPGGQA